MRTTEPARALEASVSRAKMAARNVSCSLLALFALCFPLLASDPNRLTAEEQAAGWRLLFDGETTNGWLEATGTPFPSTWNIDQGCLHAFPHVDGFQDIRTVEQFQSYELRFAWKIARGGNSGVKYLVQKEQKWKRRNENGMSARARGLEYQLTDDAASAEAKKDTTRGTASLYSVLAPPKPVGAAPDVFHQSRLIVRGHHVEHWLDGVMVLAFETNDEKVAKHLRELSGGEAVRERTPVSLQNHASEVWFRDIKIRTLE